VPRFSRPAACAAALASALLVVLPASGGGSRTLFHYGDSLAVGTDLYLDGYLRGWSVRSSTDVSRHAADVPGALRSFGPALPRVVVISVGTNDDPGAVAAFRRIVRDTLTLAGPSRCVVWTTIVRPPYRGVSYSGYNRTLRTAARNHGNLLILDWEAMARSHPAWFGPDGVHPTMTGYRARAAATAAVVRRAC
jgi:lysophospholipase L1-like esterase